MGALKHSLHSCYFCYHLKTDPLNEEVEFFNSRLGRSRTLLELLNQRRKYHRSFAFVLRCIPVLFRLHLRTAWDNRFPTRCGQGRYTRLRTSSTASAIVGDGPFSPLFRILWNRSHDQIRQPAWRLIGTAILSL
jgi:hypothetical protein